MPKSDDAPFEHFDGLKVAAAIGWIVVIVAAVLVAELNPYFNPQVPGFVFAVLVGVGVYGVFGAVFGVREFAYNQTGQMNFTTRRFRIAKFIPWPSSPGHFPVDPQRVASPNEAAAMQLARLRGSTVPGVEVPKENGHIKGHLMLPGGGFDLRRWDFASDPKDFLVHVPDTSWLVHAGDNVYFFRGYTRLEHDEVCRSCLQTAKDLFPGFSDKTPIIEPNPVIDETFATYIRNSGEAHAIVMNAVGIRGAARDLVASLLRDTRISDSRFGEWIREERNEERLWTLVTAWLDKRTMPELTSPNFDGIAAMQKRVHYLNSEVARLDAEVKKQKDINRTGSTTDLNRAIRTASVERRREYPLAPATHELADRAPGYPER